MGSEVGVGGDRGIELHKHWQRVNLTILNWKEGSRKEEGGAGVGDGETEGGLTYSKR